jgi:hypothetical protein
MPCESRLYNKVVFGLHVNGIEDIFGLTKARIIRDCGGKRSNNNTAGETPTIRPGLSKALVGNLRAIKPNCSEEILNSNN